jgi:putative ABC transport system ATP-binding protein
MFSPPDLPKSNHSMPQTVGTAASDYRLSLLTLIENLAADCGVQFDRLQAGSLFREQLTEHCDSNALLDSLATQLGLVIHRRMLTAEEALAACRNGAVLATGVNSSEAVAGWGLLRGATTTRVRLAQEHGPDLWLTHSQFYTAFHIAREAEPRVWITAEPALPCAGASSHGSSSAHGNHGHDAAHHGGHLSPLARLMAILRPDVGDIWVITIFSAIVSLLALATPITVEALVNTVAFGRLMQPVLVLSLVLFGFLGFAAALRVVQSYIAEIMQRRIFVRAVSDLSQRLPRCRVDSFGESHGPELVNRFFDIITVQKAAALLVLDGVALLLQTAVGMAVLAFYHPLLAGFDIVLLLCLAFIIFALGRGAVRTSIAESRAKYAVAAWLEQLAFCPWAFKSAGGTLHAAERADRLVIEYLQARGQHFNILLRQLTFMLGLQALAGSVLLGGGGWLVIQGQLTLGQLVAAELIVAVIIGSFAKLGKHLDSFYDLLAASDKLGHLFDLNTETTGGERLEQRPQGLALHIENLPLPAPQAEGDGLPFSASIRPGEVVAIVGPSGFGRSHLAHVLFGMLPAKGGTIELDGVDLRAIDLHDLREKVSVARGLEIIDGTVAENIHFHRAALSAAEVRTVAKQLGLFQELQAFPLGMDTPLLPSGSPLTECQVRRIVLARALVARPRLLIIDGLLDGLPDSTLADVLLALRQLGERTTVLILTGRGDIARACPRVLPLAPLRSDVRLLNTGQTDSESSNPPLLIASA